MGHGARLDSSNFHENITLNNNFFFCSIFAAIQCSWWWFPKILKICSPRPKILK
jgi:hypothetical protein